MKNLNNQCDLATCRYNHNGSCQNEEKREECVRVSKAVLCLDEQASEDVCCKNCKYMYTVQGGYSCANGDSYYVNSDVDADNGYCQEFCRKDNESDEKD